MDIKKRIKENIERLTNDMNYYGELNDSLLATIAHEGVESLNELLKSPSVVKDSKE